MGTILPLTYTSLYLLCNLYYSDYILRGNETELKKKIYKLWARIRNIHRDTIALAFAMLSILLLTGSSTVFHPLVNLGVAIMYFLGFYGFYSIYTSLAVKDPNKRWLILAVGTMCICLAWFSMELLLKEMYGW